MNNLILQILEVIIIAVAVIVTEELICYLILRKQKKLSDYKEQKAKKAFYPYSFYLYKTKKYLFFVKPIIVLLVLAAVFVQSGKNIYYDSMGNQYSSADDVLFYDENSNIYTVDEESLYFLDSSNNITYNKCIDINGFVSDVKEDDLYCTDMTGIYYTIDGDIFIENDCVYWDEKKQLHYMNVSQDVIISQCEFNVDTSSGNCTVS